MHIVTKILIIFCAVLSLLLAALTMAYAANANTLRASIRSEQELARAAQSSLADAKASHGEQMATAEKAKQAVDQQLTARTTEVAQLQSERTNLRAEVQRSQGDADSIRNQIAQIGATVDTQAKLIKNYRDEVTALRDAGLQSTKREVELLDKINDLTSAREVLEQTARALKEQLQQVKLDLQVAQQGQGSTGGTVTNLNAKGQPRELPGPLVRAMVVEVFKSPAGDDMVVINEGSNRGLKENVQMNVTRGDTFIASIVLTTVEPTRAVGRITNVRTGTVQVSDVVLSRLD